MKDKLKRLPYRQSYRFYNKKAEHKQGFVLPTLFMFLCSVVYRIRDLSRDFDVWVAIEKPIERSEQLAITWLGHSTYLIQTGNRNILLDPIFGGLSLFFPRILPVGIALNDLPPIDIVLISHNHLDHMDYASLLALKKLREPRVLVPLGVKSWFDYHVFTSVSELDWWEQKTISNDGKGSSIKITLLPATHWSQHGIFDKNKSLWGSWMIECNGRTLYFAGDTIYSNHFGEIAQEFSNIDVAFLPIGPCEPHRWMRYSHMNAQEAGKAFLDLNAKHMLPMHWGTFHFGMESFDLPIKRLQAWWNKNNSSYTGKKVHFPKIGQRIYF